MKFEMDAIESAPGTPETTRIIFQGKKLLKNFKPNHHGDNDGDFMLVDICHQHRSSLS